MSSSKEIKEDSENEIGLEQNWEIIKEQPKRLSKEFWENQERLLAELRNKRTFNKIIVPLESSDKEEKPKGKKWIMRKLPNGKWTKK